MTSGADVYKLSPAMHEHMFIAQGDGRGWYVTAVHGGWIYRWFDEQKPQTGHSVFVPAPDLLATRIKVDEE